MEEPYTSIRYKAPYGTIPEGPLVVQDELLPVGGLQRDQTDGCVLHYCPPKEKRPITTATAITELTRHLIRQAACKLPLTIPYTTVYCPQMTAPS